MTYAVMLAISVVGIMSGSTYWYTKWIGSNTSFLYILIAYTVTAIVIFSILLVAYRQGKAERAERQKRINDKWHEESNEDY